MFTKVGEHSKTIAQKADKTYVDETFATKLELTRKADVSAIKALEEQFEEAQTTIDGRIVAVEGRVATAEEAAKDAVAKAGQVQAGLATINQTVTALTTRVNGLDTRLGLLEKRLSDLNDDFKSGMATQSALIGLFQPYTIGRANVSMALGGYESKTAIAIGSGYRFNEKIATKAGFATDGSNTSYNIGINFEW